MKKNKPKAETKASKKEPKKESKKEIAKATRKELETNLSAKFKEVIESLGHEAKVISKDLDKIGKLLSKKLSDKPVKSSSKGHASLMKTLDSAIEEVKENQEKPAKTSSAATAKSSTATEKPKEKAGASVRKRAAKVDAQTVPGAVRRGRTPKSASNDTTGVNIAPDSSEVVETAARRRTVKPKAIVTSATKEGNFVNGSSQGNELTPDTETKTE